MKTTSTLLVPLCAALSLAAGACSAESKASTVLAKHEGAFRVCQEEMEKRKAAGWEHRCALVASMALDASLQDTGLDAPRIQRMRDAWLDRTGYRPLYVPADKRAP